MHMYYTVCFYTKDYRRKILKKWNVALLYLVFSTEK